MKKYLIMAMIFVFGQVHMAKADNTDVSSIENVLYIQTQSFSAGSLATLSVSMKNTAAIRGFQFTLHLPEGVKVVKDEDDYIIAELNQDRLPERDRHEIEATEKPDGSIEFLVSSTRDQTFTGTDGEIMTIAINVAANVPVGDYPIKMTYVKLSESDISHYYLTDEVVSSLTITNAVDTRVLLDETSLSVPSEALGADIRVKRTVKSGQWSTVVFPFVMGVAQLQEVFGTGMKLADFVDYEAVFDDDDNVTSLTIHFTAVTDGLEANHPYLLYSENEVTEFTLNDVDVIPDEGAACVEWDNGKTGSRRHVYGGIYGVYVAQTPVEANCLFLNDNNFWYSTGATKMKAFRAYFEFEDVLANVGGSDVKMNINVDGEATNIVDLILPTAGNVYSVDGMFYGNNVNFDRLPKGTYIVNGKKVFKTK